MSTYIEYHAELADHPDVHLFAGRLGVPYPEALGYLSMLWCQAAVFWPDGTLALVPDALLAARCAWTTSHPDRPPADFLAALRAENTRPGTAWLKPDGTLRGWAAHGIRLKHQWETRMAVAREALAVQRAARRAPLAPPTPAPSRPGTPDPDAALWVNFARVEAAYPANHKADRARAQAAWAELRPDAALTDRMLDALRAWSGSPQWQKAGGQFIPHLATWLEGTRWEDAPPLVPEDADARARKVLDLPPKRRTPGS